MLRAGDWLSRSQVLIANMHQDGVWDAYTVENDKLVYHEDKDTRDKLLKDTIKANLKKNNPDFIEDGKMTRAYDFNITQSIKAQIDSVVGGYDRETRAMYNFHALGRLFGLFKTYLPSRIDRMTSVPFQSRLIGKYELQEHEDGRREYLWKGDQLEGLFHSLNMNMIYLNRLRKGDQIELTKVQRENLYKIAGDFIMIGLASIIAAGLTSGDDKDKTDEFMSSIMLGSVRDLVSFYNIFAYGDFLSTPIAIEYMYGTAKRIYNISMNAADPNTNTLIDSLELQPFFRDLNDINDFLTEE
jgi:hypothetical protein